MKDSDVLTRTMCEKCPSCAYCCQGTCLVPCIYSVACTRAWRGTTAPQHWYPDDPSECATFIGLCLLQTIFGCSFTPCFGCYIRTETMGAKDNCIGILCRETCCGPCFCSTCVMAESLAVDHDPANKTGSNVDAMCNTAELLQL